MCRLYKCKKWNTSIHLPLPLMICSILLLVTERYTYGINSIKVAASPLENGLPCIFIPHPVLLLKRHRTCNRYGHTLGIPIRC